MYKVKHYFRFFWWLMPICSTKEMDAFTATLYLSDYFDVSIKNVNSFVGNTIVINGWKRPNVGIRMKVERCLG